nr:piggyBac transposable element-derived protein 4-like [Nerophis lumbriciformis]
MPYINQEAAPETVYIKEEEQDDEIPKFPVTFSVNSEEDEGPCGAAKQSSDGLFQYLTTKEEGQSQLDELLAPFLDSDDITSDSDFNTDEEDDNFDNNALKSFNEPSLKSDTKDGAGQPGEDSDEGGNWEEDVDDDESQNEEQEEEEEHAQGDDDERLWRSINKKIIWSPTHEMSRDFVPPTLPSPGPTKYAISRISSPITAFDLFFPDNIMDHILKMTNLQGCRAITGWTKLTAQELRAYLGLLILAGMYRSRNESTLSLWDKDLGRPIFVQTMSHGRFGQINRALRFDDKLLRPRRHHSDKLSPISDIWIKWNDILPKLYSPGRDICVDEQMVSFRGRCSFKQYMPSKPVKYGIKVWALCDVETSYALKLEVYTGKPPGDTRTSNVGMGVVLRLCDSFEGHTVTTDNFFTSFPLAEELKKKKIALVGTLRKNKGELPPALLRITCRQPLSSLFAFTKNMALVSYVPKRAENFLVLSTRHRTPEVPEGALKKPQIILDYNRCKGAVDHLDQVRITYSCRRRALRWPMCLFHYMVDISAYNAFVLFSNVKPDWSRAKLFRRRLFLLEVAKALVTPEITRRQRWRSSNTCGPTKAPSEAEAVWAVH